jgi:hypothetical protein
MKTVPKAISSPAIAREGIPSHILTDLPTAGMIEPLGFLNE